MTRVKAACWGFASCLLAGVVTPAAADGYEAAERCYRAGDLGVRITLCSRAIRSGDLAAPELASVFNTRGNARLRQGNYENAIADFDAAIRLRPDYANAYSNRANARLRQGLNDEAIADYDRAIELDPYDANAYMSRGIALGRKGMDEKAVADYARAVELDPDYAQAYYNRGIAYQALGRTKEAAQDFRRAQELMPGNPIVNRKLRELGLSG